MTEQLVEMFRAWAGEPCSECRALGVQGSNRRYFRLTSEHYSCIGTIGEDRRENEAFFSFTRHFLKKGIHVPRIYAVDDSGMSYLQEDLGDNTLYNVLHRHRQQGRGFDHDMVSLYRQALINLAHIQKAGADIDFSKAYPRAAFDRQSIAWDLNYFKYFFLKLAHVPFDEERLEDDFNHFIDLLLQADTSLFMYRDFQSRNIMVVPSNDDSSKQELFYIDYQGGRQGASQYDVVSLLYSSKNPMPEAIRNDLLKAYVQAAGCGDDFMHYYYPYALVRLMQTFGAYGYRGYCEHKEAFLNSVPQAAENLRTILQYRPLPESMTELNRVLNYIAEHGDIFFSVQKHSQARTFRLSEGNLLTVDVGSFSFLKGLPDDPSGNGGGFVFDCRALPNPGRYDEYKAYTGRDANVVAFLKDKKEVDEFLENAIKLVEQTLEVYINRRFTHLNVHFGCTGGQHRSVYCAERMADYLLSRGDVNVHLTHREQHF